MSKPIHPIRKLRYELFRYLYGGPGVHDKVIARHVKPLLDALDQEHGAIGSEYNWHGHKEVTCDVCVLLAAWRAKL
jgi:hypothetical protein